MPALRPEIRAVAFETEPLLMIVEPDVATTPIPAPTALSPPVPVLVIDPKLLITPEVLVARTPKKFPPRIEPVAATVTAPLVRFTALALAPLTTPPSVIPVP